MLGPLGAFIKAAAAVASAEIPKRLRRVKGIAGPVVELISGASNHRV
jgi:hypothetical protein